MFIISFILFFFINWDTDLETERDLALISPVALVLSDHSVGAVDCLCEFCFSSQISGRQ